MDCFVANAPRNDEYIQRYLLPQPRLALGQKLHGIATACMDVSDGLAQDAGHICAASNVGAVIEAAKLPHTHGDLMAALTGGDDYELLFTAPPGIPVPEGCTRIGTITEGSGVIVLDATNAPMQLAHTGYTHFA